MCFKLTYIVSCCKNIPDFIMKAGIVYFETVFHPVLKFTEERQKKIIIKTKCEKITQMIRIKGNFTNLKLGLLSWNIIISTDFTENFL